MKTGDEHKTTVKGPKGPFERFLIIICVLLGIGIAVSLLVFIRILFPEKKTPRPAEPSPAGASSALATPEDFIPQNIAHMKKVPDASFTDLNDKKISLSEIVDASENGVWFVFFASWCPDCDEQLSIISEMEYLSTLYGIDLVLIDRMNPEKESLPAVREKLADNHVNAPCYIDNDEVCYKAWGIKEIPTSVVVDKQYRAAEMQNATMTAGECEGMLRRVVYGRCAESLSFIRNNLMNAYGGVYTTNGPRSTTPSGTDVLSESQGLLLLNAVDTDNRELFDHIWSFTEKYMIKDGLCAWYTDVNFKTGGVNATLDDLRIWYALYRAAEKWDDSAYRNAALNIMRSIQQHCINAQGYPVDYVDLNDFSQAQTTSLCYPDLSILKALAEENDYFASVEEKSRRLVTEGYISDEFPLYYSKYDHSVSKYGKDDLNTAEALYTLWNLSRADLLPETSLSWLREHVENSNLYARYHVDGSVVAGYEYHSTAVYGLAALIAHEEGDDELWELALRRMERLYIIDHSDPNYGSYSQGNEETYAFDQLISLMVQNILDEEAAYER